jgi:hypothetical protein
VTLSGFDASDTLHFSGGHWASFSALMASGDVIQSGADTVVRLDANDVLTLTGVKATQLTASAFAFS